MTLTSAAPQLEMHHIQALVRAMYTLALHDGIHDTERVMLRGFYESCQADTQALTSFEDIVRTPLDESTLPTTFDTPELKTIFVQSCLLLAYADGHYTAGERGQLLGWAKALGLADQQLGALEDGVSDHLMQQIAQVNNTDALREVAAKM
ncbi:MAG TPA: hypothetical protein VLA16_10900, partial [Ideonella sp.]|nr:hypothetical protein [Ideonella sp.]